MNYLVIVKYYPVGGINVSERNVNEVNVINNKLMSYSLSVERENNSLSKCNIFININ